jgi:hypothetical protein
LLQIITLVTSLIFLIINVLIDLSYGMIDGRLSAVRRGGGWFARLLRRGAAAEETM